MMTNRTITIGDEIALILGEDGPSIATPADAMSTIGEAMGAGVATLVIPTQRLAASFFELRSGLAGELVQKCVNYRIRLVVVGDIEAELAESNALRDFVREAGRGRQVRFVRTLEEAGGGEFE